MIFMMLKALRNQGGVNPKKWTAWNEPQKTASIIFEDL